MTPLAILYIRTYKNKIIFFLFDCSNIFQISKHSLSMVPAGLEKLQQK